MCISENASGDIVSGAVGLDVNEVLPSVQAQATFVFFTSESANRTYPVSSVAPVVPDNTRTESPSPPSQPVIRGRP
jgi:hypothetical protein